MEASPLQTRVAQAFDQRKKILKFVEAALGPMSDRQLAKLIPAHPITLRRTINNGCAVESSKPYVYAERTTIAQRVDELCQPLTDDEISKLFDELSAVFKKAASN